MAEKIQAHAAGVEALRDQIAAVLDSVETLTDTARQKLRQYQDMKEQTELLLDQASDNYDRADAALRQGANLADTMTMLQGEQRKLDREALCMDGEKEQLTELREELGRLASEIKQIRLHRRWGSSAEQKAVI